MATRGEGNKARQSSSMAGRTAGANGEQLPYLEKVVALTKLYSELSLPLPDALRAAEADL